MNARCPEIARRLARPATKGTMKRSGLGVLQEESDVADAQATILQ
jgi:hypothetical protein